MSALNSALSLIASNIYRHQQIVLTLEMLNSEGLVVFLQKIQMVKKPDNAGDVKVFIAYDATPEYNGHISLFPVRCF